MVTFPWDDSPACTDTENAVCEEDDTFYDLALSYDIFHLSFCILFERKIELD